MILKYGDNDNGWSWIGDVRRATELRDDSEWDIDLGDDDDNSSIIEVEYRNGDRLVYNLSAKKVYLCNDDTGSTIDVIKN